jgi:hypothetical protein
VDRLGDVLDVLLTQILKNQFDLVLDLLINLAGDADAARLGSTFQARCYVDPVAIEVVALDDEVADVDANTEDDPTVFRLIRRPLSHAFL